MAYDGNSDEKVESLVQAVERRMRGKSPEKVRLALKAEAYRRKVKYEPTEEDVQRISSGIRRTR